MKKYKNVIFNLDGTLIDTAPDIARCINIMLQKRSVPPLDIEIIRHFIGGGTDIFIKKLYETLKIPLTKDELSEEVRKYTDIYRMGEPAEFGKNRTLRFSGHP
ncbi:MAG: HAD hydrolase-like protein [Commensalibacter sp.]